MRERFSSILKIINSNANLYQYASTGHYNDMDMLPVGRGMSYEEDKAYLLYIPHELCKCYFPNARYHLLIVFFEFFLFVHNQIKF